MFSTRNCLLCVFFKKILRWQVTILWSHWYSLFRTSVDSAHGFHSHGGSIIAYALLLLVHNDPESNSKFSGLGLVILVPLSFRDGWQIQTHNLVAQSLSYPGRLVINIFTFNLFQFINLKFEISVLVSNGVLKKVNGRWFRKKLFGRWS